MQEQQQQVHAASTKKIYLDRAKLPKALYLDGYKLSAHNREAWLREVENCWEKLDPDCKRLSGFGADG